ncbi:putative cytochrome b-c1 complex subunit 8 [Arabidopsis thaliana]
MGKQPVKLKAVVYALSPFQQKIMTGLWKDLPEKIHHKVSENWISATLLVTPVVGTYWYSFSLSISLMNRLVKEPLDRVPIWLIVLRSVSSVLCGAYGYRVRRLCHRNK